jgi:hypothetical protein
MSGVSHHSTIPYIITEVEEQIKKYRCIKMLDVGFGIGTHANYIRRKFQWDSIHLTGIEGFIGYIKPEHNQGANFDMIFIGDASQIIPNLKFEYHFVLCADVIEHLERESGILLLESLKEISRSIMVTLPVCDYPQGALSGNQYEVHRTQWKEKEMNDIGFKTVKIITFGEIQHPDLKYKDQGFQGVFKWSR